jgi:hypothetical protein
MECLNWASNSGGAWEAAKEAGSRLQFKQHDRHLISHESATATSTIHYGKRQRLRSQPDTKADNEEVSAELLATLARQGFVDSPR